MDLAAKITHISNRQEKHSPSQSVQNSSAFKFMHTDTIGMKSLFDRISHIGMSGQELPAAGNKIKICNQVAFSFAAAIVVSGMMFLPAKNWEGIYWSAFFVVIAVSPILANYYGAHRLGRQLLIFLFYLLLLLIARTTGEPSNIEFGMLLLLAIGHIFYKRTDLRRWLSLYCLVGLVGCLLIFQYTEPYLEYPYPALSQIFNAIGMGWVTYLLFAHYREASEQKEQRLMEAGERYKAAQEQLLRVNKELDHFASVASHDMKEPLRMISSFGRLLERRMPADPSSQEFLHFIQDAAQRMSRLLDNLISYARVGKRLKEQEVVDLQNTVLLVCDQLRQKIDQSGGQVDVGDLPLVRGHSDLLRLLFYHLISNGLLYRKDSVAPQIQISAKRQGDFWCICVADNGIGMETDYHQKIFEPFTRLHAINQYEGSGIGLATCKKIVSCYQGQIWVESSEGEGASFFFTLPYEPPEQFQKLPSSQLSLQPV